MTSLRPNREPWIAPDAVTGTDNMRGAMWMLMSSFAFAAGSVCIKSVGTELPTVEVVFFRCLFGLTVIVPFVIRYGFSVFRTQRPDLHVVRVVCAAVGMTAGFYATANLDLATAVSLNYTRPLFMIVLAVMFLGEVVRWRRGLATLIGFCGVLVMLGPQDFTISLPMISALIAALAVAGAMSVVKQQAAVDGPATIMVWFGVGTAVITGIPALFIWVTPTTEQWLLMFAIGTVSSIGQYMMIRALAIGEITVMNPIDYVQILLGAVSGYFIFGEVPTIWTAIGALIIVGSTLYILFREAAINKPPLPLVKE